MEVCGWTYACRGDDAAEVRARVAGVNFEGGAQEHSDINDHRRWKDERGELDDNRKSQK